MDTFSHSTGLVDNRPQRRRWYRDPHPDNRPYREAEDFEYEIAAAGGWGRGVYRGAYGRQGSKGTDSYPYKEGGNFDEDLCRPAVHERQVVYADPDMFVVWDRFSPNDDRTHDYEIRWQLDSVDIVQEGEVVSTADAGRPDLAVVPLWTKGLAVEAVSAQNEPEIMGWKARAEPVPATTLRHRRGGPGAQEFLTLLLPLEAEQSAPAVQFAPDDERGGVLHIADGRAFRVSAASGDEARLRLDPAP
jgi:hypothetical protein